jgi:hypothetical protein
VTARVHNALGDGSYHGVKQSCRDELVPAIFLTVERATDRKQLISTADEDQCLGLFGEWQNAVSS